MITEDIIMNIFLLQLNYGLVNGWLGILLQMGTQKVFIGISFRSRSQYSHWLKKHRYSEIAD